SLLAVTRQVPARLQVGTHFPRAISSKSIRATARMLSHLRRTLSSFRSTAAISRGPIPGTPYARALRISASNVSYSDSILIFIGALFTSLNDGCALLPHGPPQQLQPCELRGTHEVPRLPAES